MSQFSLRTVPIRHSFPVHTLKTLLQALQKRWCGRGDLNPHAFWAPPPQDGVSANFTTSAHNQKRQKAVFKAGLRGTHSIAKTVIAAQDAGCACFATASPTRRRPLSP